LGWGSIFKILPVTNTFDIFSGIFNALNLGAAHGHIFAYAPGKYPLYQLIVNPTEWNLHVCYQSFLIRLCKIKTEVKILNHSHKTILYIVNFVSFSSLYAQALSRKQTRCKFEGLYCIFEAPGDVPCRRRESRSTFIFAYPAAFSVACGAGYIKLAAWLGKRKMMRAEPGFSFIAVQFLAKARQAVPLRSLIVMPFVNHKPLYLMKKRRMGCVNSIASVNPARRNNLYRRLLPLHNTYLNRRGLSTQQNIFVYIKGILGIPGGMPLGNIQRLEIVIIKLYLGPSAISKPCR
jgi:hypothetical protein